MVKNWTDISPKLDKSLAEAGVNPDINQTEVKWKLHKIKLNGIWTKEKQELDGRW